MSILKEFSRELGGDPEPWFQRLLRSGVRPVELAGALQEYLAEGQHVTDDGVIVPNVFHISLGTADHARLGRYGVALPRALGTVVVETAADRGWLLTGPVKVRIDRDELIRAGTYRLTGRIEAVEGWTEPGPATVPAASAVPAPTTRTAVAAPDGIAADPDAGAPGTDGPEDRSVDMPAADSDRRGPFDPALQVRTGVDAGAQLILDGRRVTAGRGTGCDLVVRDTTVSREHAAFVQRNGTWWVLDLGSTNGTRVNGLRAAEHPITTGDRIELGDVVVELVEV
jgi:hypothetical protein